MKALLLLALMIPALAFGQKSKVSDSDLIGVWHRDHSNLNNDYATKGSDFYTFFEFNKDNTCIIDNNYGFVWAMSYGKSVAKWTLSDKSIILNIESQITSSTEEKDYSGEFNTHKLIYKITKTKSWTNSNNEEIQLFELKIKDVSTGQKYVFYKGEVVTH
jgi:hypothetical protein